MWHKFKEFAEWLTFVAGSKEQTLYSQCKFYSYDDDAFEESCNCPKIKRKKDFDASEECWRCLFYQKQE